MKTCIAYICLVLAFSCTPAPKTTAVKNGFYEVAGKAKKNTLLIAPDKMFSKDIPVDSLLIDTREFIPLELKEKPVVENGKLLLTFKEGMGERIRDFTAARIGKQVALVAGNRVITVKLLRDTIREGKMEISGDGMDVQYLLTKLSQK